MAQTAPSFKTLCKDPALLCAFGFGSGLSPKAPGTAGSLLALALMPVASLLPTWGYALALLICFFAGIYFCQHASRRLGCHDHGGIVWDEFVGIWLALSCVPPTWPWWISGFLIFRALDIAKPWPIRLADKKVSGGFGIMLDDVIAGVATLLVLLFAEYLW